MNVPVYEGCDDEQYLGLFKPIITKVMESYQPGAVVLQCGASALECVVVVVVVLGGGGGGGGVLPRVVQHVLGLG